MTPSASSAFPAGPSALRAGSSASSGTPSTGRLIGIDLARGLAVFGMYATHVGPDPSVGGPVGFLMEAAPGRATTLFALLARFTLVIITGRPHPPDRARGAAGRGQDPHPFRRPDLGSALTFLDTPIDVILAYYGLTFIAVLPLYRLHASTLAVITAAGALVLPQVLYMVRNSIGSGSWADTVIGWDPLAWISDSDGLIEPLFTGEYPVLIYIPFVTAGMAVARFDVQGLNTPSQRARLSHGRRLERPTRHGPRQN